MPLLSDTALKGFDKLGEGDGLTAFLLDLMRRHPTGPEAQEGVRQLLARLTYSRPGPKPWPSQVEWARHDWISLAARAGQTAWAHALLDQAMDPDMAILQGRHCIRAGWALRETLALDEPDPQLVARLWGLADVPALVAALHQKISARPKDATGLRQADRAAVWLLDQPEQAEAVAALYASAGPQGMPRYAAALQARARQQRTPARTLSDGARARFRS